MAISRRSFLKGALSIAGTGSLLSYTFFYEPSFIKKEEVSLFIEDLPLPLCGKRILHLSDFHFRKGGMVFERAIDLAKKTDYDLLCYTGDFVEARSSLQGMYEVIREIPVREGAFAVMGNWEHWGSIDATSLKADLKRLDVSLLVNEGERAVLDGEEIAIYGVDDPSTGLHDLRATLKSVERTQFYILLSHAPSILDHVIRYTYHFPLILAGHTHGGQIRLPLVGPIWLPKGSSGYISGLYRVGRNIMYLTRGVGTSLFPVRFLCPPEFTLITLRPV